MAGIGNSITDDLYLKLAEDSGRGRHTSREGRTNSKYNTDSNNGRNHLQRGVFQAATNRGASTSKENNSNHVEAYQNGGKKRKFFPGTGPDKTFHQQPKGKPRNQSLNRRQFGVFDKEADESNSFERHRPMKRSQSTQGRNEKPYKSMQSEGNSKHQGHFIKQLGFRRLQDLCNNTPTEIVTFLINPTSGFEELLNTDLRPDLLILIVKVLAKACSCDFAFNKNALLTKTCQSRFLENIKKHLCDMPIEESTERKHGMGAFISDLLVYYETILNVLPNTASDKFKNLFITTNITLKSVEDYHRIILTEQIEQFSKLNKQLMGMIEERQTKNIAEISKNELQKFSRPPDDFREKSIYPTQDDLFGEKTPFLRPNIIEGSYIDVEHYLDVQFRLLREDFVAPLREGLAKYLDESIDKKKKYRIDNIRIYQNVTFGDPKVVNDLIGIFVHFDPQKKMKIKWEYSKRFMFGSLLLFTNDNFKNVIFGTILERDIGGLRKGEIIVNLHQQSEKLNVYESPFLMVESEVYFEPYKHVMRALQGFNENSFPMKEYIIFVQKDSPPPKYLLQSPEFTYVVDEIDIQVLNEHSWPSKEQLGLDKSQLAAFKSALTEEFVVIQGPPGTGKTFLGLKVAKALLQNTPIWNIHRSPILVVCYTNHALDQFLEGLISTTEEIVRVGGQSKSAVLSKFNLREKRKVFNFRKANAHLKREYHCMMTELMRFIRIYQANLEELKKHRGIVSVTFLKQHQIISSQQMHCFECRGAKEDEILQEWLMQGFEEYYGSVFDIQEDRGIVEDEDIVGGGAAEEDEIWHTAEDDPILFDLGDIAHNLEYAIDLQSLEERIKKFQIISETYKNSPLAPEYRLEEENCLYQQEILKYLQTCLKMNHHSKAAYVQRLHSFRNIWQLNVKDRWLLYKDWINTLKNILREKIHKNEEQYRDYAKRFEEIKQICNAEVMQQALVVGMTTTNAARLQNLLQALKPRIVIIEEAAEVLESHVVVSLTNKCEHVILIGDHKQLRPNPAVYKLARQYNFDISLFERMVNNGLKCHCLENQHRMRPEIAQLIVPTIYPDLKNDLSVYNYAAVRGITKSLFFITHNIPEEEVDEIMSHKNCYEADFILALCRHLIWQGYKPEEITILVTYKGQMFYMKQKQKQYSIVCDVNVTVVDNYQGEENKIILLSLVRSNKDAKIGFLSTENRVCVALSRAKEGLYIVGNMDNLVESSKIWPKIKDSLMKQESYGTHLTLQCEIHHDQQTLVNCAEDFKKVPEGGCSLLCEVQLQCGHQCESVCHVNNREHKEYKCYKKCERVPQDCEFQHLCRKLCYEPCGNCEILVERILPCGHVKTLPCYVNIKEYRCQEKVEVELPNCQHKVTKPCYRDIATYPCSVPCPDRLPCGHSCTLKCHVMVDPDHLEYKCCKPCPKTNAGCTMNHQCTKRCFEECGLCNYEVEKNLPNCNHVQRMNCCKDPSTFQCPKKCTKTMMCGHACPRKCYEDCGGCQVKVKKVIPSCGHYILIKCCEIPDQALCKQPCQRLLPCGHGCVLRCGQECTKKCSKLIRCPVVPLCGHSINIPCHLKETADAKSHLLLPYCEMPCGQSLSCGHYCQGTCGECMQGRIHVVCKQKCDRSLVCGHKCKIPCSASCPPCKAKCQYKCKHSRCNRKCGEPCAPCQERCNWNCEHLRCNKKCHEMCDREPCYEPCKKKLKCGHDCIGFCGDFCPPLCRTCDEEEVTEVFFGNEDNENARFVYLVDCKHTMESEGLETWLQQSDREIVQKTCPRCKTPIIQTQRFMNYVKQKFIDTSRVKRKVFGEINSLEKERKKLSRTVKEMDSLSLKGVLTMRSKKYRELLTMCSVQLNQVQNNRRHFLSQGDLQSIKSEIEIFSDLVTSIDTCIIKSKIPLKENVAEKLFNQFDFLLEKIQKRHGSFSAQETSDFNRECKRFFGACQLAVIESSPNFSYLVSQVSVKTLYQKACSILLSIEIYSDKKHVELKNIINTLKKAVGNIVVSERERKEIVQAIGLRQGHWFKCPNGHIYCIGECGGAMEVAKCPECGEAIGGSNHHLLSSNRLASEMDGAQRHAFAGGLY
ncbi:Regulator of nonsense transcripts 1 homolog [Gryllus bimaculatus]|nr:Regulator of nonsense transcripts 1 homolog [Gryllus bimaculatus]